MSQTPRMTRTDEELVALATAGDLDSFNQLVSRWERPIYALAYRTLGREEDARDVVQDAFLNAFKSLDRFEGNAKLSTWLHRIVVNAALMKVCEVSYQLRRLARVIVL